MNVLIRAELPELEQRAASAEITPRPPNGQIKRPIAQILSPESRITEPEDEFEPARDEPIHCENEPFASDVARFGRRREYAPLPAPRGKRRRD
jgi:hypothetical protein